MLILILLIVVAMVIYCLRNLVAGNFLAGWWYDQRCRILPHARARRAVTRAGDVYRSSCRYCGIAMIKEAREGGWHAVDSVVEQG